MNTDAETELVRKYYEDIVYVGDIKTLAYTKSEYKDEILQQELVEDGVDVRCVGAIAQIISKEKAAHYAMLCWMMKSCPNKEKRKFANFS